MAHDLSQASLWRWLTPQAVQLWRYESCAMGKSETCLRGAWENPGTHLQTLLILLWEKSSGTPEDLLSSLLVIFSRSSFPIKEGIWRHGGDLVTLSLTKIVRWGREEAGKLDMPITAKVNQSASEQQDKIKCNTVACSVAVVAWGRKDYAWFCPCALLRP